MELPDRQVKSRSRSRSARARTNANESVGFGTYLMTKSRLRFSGADIDRTVSLALFVAAVVMLVFYLAVTYLSTLNSDSAMKLMLGQEMAHQFSLVPRGWDYENDIPIIFPSLIAAAFAMFVVPSYPMHVAVDIVAAGLLLYAAYAASRAVGISGPLRWFAPTLMASGISKDFAEFVFGQSAYSGSLFALFVIAGCGARYLSAPPEVRNHLSRRSDALAVGLIICAGVAGGARGLAAYALPTLSALLASYVFANRQVDIVRQRTRALLLTSIAATCVGGLCFLFLLSRVSFHSGSIPHSLSDVSHISHNICTSAKNWLALFGSLPDSVMPLSGLTAIPYAARFAFALIAFFLPLALLVRVRQIESASLRFLIFLHVSLLGALGSVCIFTGMLDHEPNGIPRYFSPLLATSFLIFGLWLQTFGARNWFPAARIGWVCALAFLTFSPRLLVAPAFADWSRPSLGLATNPRTQIISALENAGLTNGYASYWSANAITVLSGGRISALPILFDDSGLPRRQHHMTADRWFEQPMGGARFFLLLDPSDKSYVNRAALEKLLGPPIGSLNAGNFEAIVYPTAQQERLGFSAPKQPVVVPKAPATCSAAYEALGGRMELKPNAFGNLRVRATNRSTLAWSPDSSGNFGPGLRIDDMKGLEITELRARLPHTVAAGESVVLDIPLRAPEVGEYTVKFSFVIEGYAWCGNLGANWASVPLSVKP